MVCYIHQEYPSCDTILGVSPIVWPQRGKLDDGTVSIELEAKSKDNSTPSKSKSGMSKMFKSVKSLVKRKKDDPKHEGTPKSPKKHIEETVAEAPSDLPEKPASPNQTKNHFRSKSNDIRRQSRIYNQKELEAIGVICRGKADTSPRVPLEQKVEIPHSGFEEGLEENLHSGLDDTLTPGPDEILNSGQDETLESGQDDVVVEHSDHPLDCTPSIDNQGPEENQDKNESVQEETANPEVSPVDLCSGSDIEENDSSYDASESYLDETLSPRDTFSTSDISKYHEATESDLDELFSPRTGSEYTEDLLDNTPYNTESLYSDSDEDSDKEDTFPLDPIEGVKNEENTPDDKDSASECETVEEDETAEENNILHEEDTEKEVSSEAPNVRPSLSKTKPVLFTSPPTTPQRPLSDTYDSKRSELVSKTDVRNSVPELESRVYRQEDESPRDTQLDASIKTMDGETESNEKFNLEARMKKKEEPKVSNLVAKQGRMHRRAAIFKKTSDRYSQLHSNVEKDDPVECKSNAVSLWAEKKEGNIVFSTESIERPELTASTLNQLVKYLTGSKNLDGDTLRTFLLTYNSFTSPKTLFEKLRERYNIPEEKATKMEPEMLKKKQLRVINVMKKWLETCFLDLDDNLINDVFAFCEKLRADGNTSLATLIDNSLLSKFVGLTKKKQIHEEQPPTKPKVPKVPNPTFDDMDAKEIARQLTILDSRIYSEIKASELLKQAWNVPHLKFRAPHVLALIQRFNYTSAWVSSTIVNTESINERTRVMTKFIEIAHHLLKLQNFNGLMTIVSGLQSSCVHRLSLTKEGLSSKSSRRLQKYLAIMDSRVNFQRYREALANCSPPALPYLGIYLTNLVFIEDGNADYVNGLINFKKRKLVSKVIEQITKFQVGKQYNLVEVESISRYLNDLPKPSDEKQLYELSLKREPRKPVN